MASVSTYLNFSRETEEAFNFYKSVFGTEFIDGIHRLSEVLQAEGQPPISDDDKDLVMHVSLPILDGHILMGTDAPESMGFTIIKGNNMHISLQPDTRKETEKLFEALSQGGIVEMALQEMFWGDYYGACTDKFGIPWMFNCTSKE